MLIGVISDVHDQLSNLERALKRFEQEGVSEIIFCGDFCAPFSAKMMAQTGLPVHAIFGNNDGDRFTIARVTSGFDNVKLYGEYIGDLDSQLVLDGLKVGVTHYPYYAKPMIKTGWYDCVFFGHSHKAEKQKFGHNLLLNPGEVAGLFGKPSLAIIDTQVRSSVIIEF